MARQILKGLAMLMLIVGLALVSAVAANGQGGEKLIAQVPFDFIVGNKTLASGQYHVRAVNSAGDALSIRNAESKDQALSLTDGTGSAKDRNNVEARLVFHRCGNTYFLSQVWMAGSSAGRELRKTRQERAIEREMIAIAPRSDLNKPVYEVVEIVATVR
jgi:hypothetical protein